MRSWAALLRWHALGAVSKPGDPLDIGIQQVLTGNDASRSGLFSRTPPHFLGRLYFLAAVLVADCGLLASTTHRAGLLGVVAPFGIAAFAVFLGLGRATLRQFRNHLPFYSRPFWLHVLCVALIYLPYQFAPRGIQYRKYALPAHIYAIVVLSIALLLLVFACIPLRAWVQTLRATSPLWLVTLIAGVLAAWLRYPLQAAWGSPETGTTTALQLAAFHSVHTALRVFLPNVVVDPSTFIIGTQRFAVRIQDQCSGMEGLGLVLVFTTIWLWYFRKENRFPQALLLIPCALGFVWVLNIVRLCAIILIGNAGAPDIAMIGFHSQAGWIAFTAVALSFSMATQKLSWVRRAPSYATSSAGGPGVSHSGIDEIPSGPDVLAHSAETEHESPATAAYLVPFLAILAASFVSKASSGYFEWLYPLRAVAAAIALWSFRRQYKTLDWSFGWAAPAAGIAMFFIWMAPEWLRHQHPASTLGTSLAALTPAARYTWISFRVAAATVTVPLAEELAFRGYLARRVMSRNFDSIPFTGLSLLAVIVSSAVFGLMHGQHWLTGVLAGLAYAAVMKWKGRMGDAVVAHATTNLLLAAWVLVTGDWGQW